MLARIALGGEVDFATPGEVDTSVDRVLDFLRDRKVPRPTFNTVPQSKTGLTVAPGTNTLAFEIGSPPTGRLWNILSLTLCGNDDFGQSTAGTVGFYIGAMPTTGTPSLGQLVAPRLTVPTVQSFTKGTYWCASNESLILNLAGLVLAANHTQVVGSVRVAEWREDDILDSSTR